MRRLEHARDMWCVHRPSGRRYLNPIHRPAGCADASVDATGILRVPGSSTVRGAPPIDDGVMLVRAGRQDRSRSGLRASVKIPAGCDSRRRSRRKDRHPRPDQRTRPRQRRPGPRVGSGVLHPRARRASARGLRALWGHHGLQPRRRGAGRSRSATRRPCGTARLFCRRTGS